MQYGGYGMAEMTQQQQQQQHQHQQFMEGDSCSSLFSISQKQNQLHYHHYHQPHLPPEQEHKHERQQHFFQLHPVPFTQQLLHQQQEYEAFQLQQRRVVLHQQMRLENELGGGGGRRGGGVGNGASLPFFNFKLGLNENSTGNREVVMDGEDQGDQIQEEHIPAGNRSNSLEMPPPPQCCWESQEDGTIKEPFWKPLNPQVFNKNDKESNEDEEKTEEGKANKEISNHNNVNNNNNAASAAGKNLGIKYTFFGELEAICGGARLGKTNQTGCGSGLTGENLPRNAGMSRTLPDPHSSNLGSAAAAAATSAAAGAAIGVDHGSEASIGEEGSVRNVERRKRRRRRRRRRKAKEELNSVAGFLESFVKQVMDHQEGLYRKFLQVVERIDEERIGREEAWRSQQLHNFNREATTRAHEQALASAREVAIVSYLEKITGQTINLPDKIDSINNNNTSTHPQPSEATKIRAGNSRWPKSEVQALIQVRSSLEARFQEPGLKGPLWEEISSSMAVMGYQRSAKRCKEKWENINKYFRKTKDTNKKRSQHSKTCPYFHQLDQLYSRTPRLYRKGNSELLDAVVSINDPNITAPMATSASAAIDDVDDDRAEADPQINHDAGDHENDDNTDVEEGEDGQDMKDEEDEDDEEGGDGDEEDGD